MEAGRAIRLVSVFVVGVVIAVGGAMIYSVASQMRPAPQPQPPEIASKLTKATPLIPDPVPDPSASKTPPSDTVVEVPEQPSEQVTQPHQVTQPAVAPPPKPQASTQLISERPSPRSTESADAWKGPISNPVQGTAPTTQAETPQKTVFAPFRPQQESVQPRTVTLWSGTSLTIKLNDEISTAEVTNGQPFRATLAAPIIQNGFIIADTGSPVTGQVIESKQAGAFRAADLRLCLIEIHTTDNQTVRIQSTAWDDRGHSRNPVSSGIRSAIGATVGAFNTVAHGDSFAQRSSDTKRNVVLPANTILEFQLAAPLSLTEHTK